MEKIIDILPHRSPFLFLDEIKSVSNDRIITQKKFMLDDYFFKGHFPNEPVVPGVIITEIFAQSAAYLIMSQYPEYKNSYLVEINKTKFNDKIEPNSLFEAEIIIEKQFQNIYKFSAVGTVGNKNIASSIITIAFN